MDKKKMTWILVAAVAVLLVGVILLVVRPWQNNPFSDYTGMTTSADEETTESTDATGDNTQPSGDSTQPTGGNSGSGNSGSGNSGSEKPADPTKPTVSVELEDEETTKPTGSAVIDFDDLLDKVQG